MADETPAPPEQGRAAPSIAEELSAVHERFRLIEQIDQQTSEMVARLAEAISVSAEARAFASLNISISLQGLAELLESRQDDQLETLSAISSEIVATQSIAEEVQRAVLGLESRLSSSLQQLEIEPDPDNENPAPAAPRLKRAVVIESVPNAVVALAIQHFLSGRPGVVDVIARSFAKGRLRFDVQFDGSTGDCDLVSESKGGLVRAGDQSGDSVFALTYPNRFLNNI